MTTRRTLLGGAAALAFAPAQAREPAQARGGAFPVARTDAEWRRVLTSTQFQVLRRHGTERAGSSPLDREKRAGSYACAGCGRPLFSSADKYDSGTGWPAFTRPSGAVGFSRDASLGVVRKEVHCAGCGGHLGHVFDDGPPPTGERFCVNGAALRFSPGGR